jgi:hypothetical protein
MRQKKTPAAAGVLCIFCCVIRSSEPMHKTPGLAAGTATADTNDDGGKGGDPKIHESRLLQN